MSHRLSQTLALNDDFAKAYRKREPWALKRAEQIIALDNPVGRHPDRVQNMMANHCGSCPWKNGCMVCDLDYDLGMKDIVGTLKDDTNPARHSKPRRSK